MVIAGYQVNEYHVTPFLLFGMAIGLLAYTYVGFRVVMTTAARFAGRPVAKAHFEPAVTVIVSAYNEEASIRSKLDNLLALDYPTDKLDIIVVSDGSTDSTDALVIGYSQRVSLLRVDGRVGKTACQNAAANVARGDLIVFTDATTIIEKNAMTTIARNFADPSVGCVAALLVYVDKGESLTAAGGTAYWGYEIALRLAESVLGSLIGVSGCLYAVRRSAYRSISPELISDFVIAMSMREQGLRTVLEPDARCFENTLDLASQELSMRVRVAIRSISALVSERRFLNPFRFGLFAIQLISHKALRYASPFIWLTALISNALLLEYWPMQVIFACQVALLVAGSVGFAIHATGRRVGVLVKPYYLLLTNLASLVAVFRYLRGERVRVWNPVRA